MIAKTAEKKEVSNTEQDCEDCAELSTMSCFECYIEEHGLGDTLEELDGGK